MSNEQWLVSEDEGGPCLVLGDPTSRQSLRMGYHGAAQHLNAARAAVEAVTAERDAARMERDGIEDGLVIANNSCKRRGERIKALEAERDAAVARAGEMEKALTWYAEQVAGCRKLTGEGDGARHALDSDGGKRAQAALASRPPQDERAAAREGRLAECLELMMSYLQHEDQDANHMWMVKTMRAAVRCTHPPQPSPAPDLQDIVDGMDTHDALHSDTSNDGLAPEAAGTGDWKE